MANFQPFNRYTFFLLENLIDKYNLSGPFLDIGCGAGELSLLLSKRDWHGKAIDYSDQSIKQALKLLSKNKNIKTEKKDFYKERGKFKSIFLWDVLEHLKDDNKAIKKISSLLLPKGHLIISVPSNPRQWGWDDEFYGHYRRYSQSSIKKLLRAHGLKTIIIWDSTFPIFWLIRKLYLVFKSKPNLDYKNKEKRTKKSATEMAWNIPLLSSLANNSRIIWLPVYFFQFNFFRRHVDSGFEMLVLAQKR